MTIAADELTDLPGLRALWGQFAGETVAEPPPLRPLLDSIGLGLGETLALLGNTRPSWEEFLAWIAATANPPEADGPARYRSWYAGDPTPPAEAARQAAVMAAPDVLDAAELARWEQDGVAVLRQAIEAEAAAAVAARVWELVGGDPDDPASWYARGGSIMIDSFQHPAMMAPRRSARVRKAFAQLYGHADLLVSTDRVSFNPPERSGYAFQGPHLHWDANLTLPMPFETQGILYLTDTAADQGALQVVPGFHHRLQDWLAGLGDADPRAVDLSAEAVTVPAGAGDLVIWRQELPHGASPNRNARPRLAQYVNMYPMHRPDQRAWR